MPLPRRFPRRAALLAVLAGLTLAGCTQAVDGTPGSAASTGGGSASAPVTPSAAPSTPSGSFHVTPAAFHDCQSVLSVKGVSIAAALKGKLTATCATVGVPADYSQPDGKQLQLVMVRFHDSDNSGHTPLFVNPGGPGGSGVELALGLLGKLPTVVFQHYDLLGFDPRGAALSAPIQCLTNAQKDEFYAASPDVTTTAGFDQAKAEAAEFAQRCAARLGSTLADYTTVNSARDLDVLRQALGQNQLDYLGFSWGTQLGSEYAHFYPSRVGTMVLDGAVDPLTTGIQQGTFQLHGFEQAFGQFAAYCRSTGPCSQLGDPVSAARSIQASAQVDPLPTGTSRRLTAALAATGMQEAMYDRTSWSKLATALVEAHGGDGSGLLQLADEYNHRFSGGNYDNLIDAFDVISCNDSPTGPSDTQIRTTIRQWVADDPVFGKYFALGLFSCQGWQPHRSVPPKPTAATATKVLVVGNLHDPATPYQGAIDLAKTMGNAEVLSWNGEGHTSYLGGSSCVDGYVDAFLVHDTMPPDRTTCPAK